jgi:hypothetical protein
LEAEKNPVYFNDLWRYNTSTNTWTWIHGSNDGDQSGVKRQLDLIEFFFQVVHSFVQVSMEIKEQEQQRPLLGHVSLAAHGLLLMEPSGSLEVMDLAVRLMVSG